MVSFTESTVEQAALAWLEGLGYQILPGLEIAPDQMAAEREHYGQVVLERRLREALQRLNPQVPSDALDEAFRKLTRPDSPSLVANNHSLHRMLVEGITVECSAPSPRSSPAGRGVGGEGARRHEIVKVLDFDNPDANEFVAVNQFTVVEAGHERRPDIVLFVNGLPVAVIELKNAATASRAPPSS
jgi:type I restriction enzyme R subunit